jgi:hypothetical protein
MQWWRQIFYTTGFVEHNPSAIIVFGKDVSLLKSTLRRWDYLDATKLRLLVIVDENVVDQPETCDEVVWERRREVLRAISMPFVWDLDLRRLSGRQVVGANVAFFTRYNRVAIQLDRLWSEHLLDRTEPFSSAEWRFSMRACQDRGPFRAWYADMPRPDCLIQQAISGAYV